MIQSQMLCKNTERVFVSTVAYNPWFRKFSFQKIIQRKLYDGKTQKPWSKKSFGSHRTLSRNSPQDGSIVPGVSEFAKDKSSKNVAPLVGIVMDSDTDLPVMKILSEYSLPYEERGIWVIVAADGGAAHLAGMTASLTSLPVIGVPLRASALDGIDSLLSMAQMPRGVPVATVAVDNAASAGFLAGGILGLDDVDLLAELDPLFDYQSFSPRVEIIMDSDSDLYVMKDAARVLSDFGIPHGVKIVSAHRSPEMMFQYASTVHERGNTVIIAGACSAVAHLPGMVASLTPLTCACFSIGWNSICTDMEEGPTRINCTVATVAINNAENAALLAERMWGNVDAGLRARMMQFQEDMRDDNLRKTEKLHKIGWGSSLNL